MLILFEAWQVAVYVLEAFQRLHAPLGLTRSAGPAGVMHPESEYPSNVEVPPTMQSDVNLQLLTSGMPKQNELQTSLSTDRVVELPPLQVGA
jgi:hypothetical protein